MPNPKIIGAQRDFSSGELDVALKRADEIVAMRTGARQLANMRILSSGQASQRPGRQALFQEPGRVEKIQMSPGNKFYLVFGVGYLRVYNAAGVQVFNTTFKGDGATAIPWTAQTINNASFAVLPAPNLAVYIAYADGAPNNVQQVLTWDGVSQTSKWTLSTYAEAVTVGGRKNTVFTRISPQSITMLPSAATGAITLTFSAPIGLSAAWVGSRLLYCGRQILVTGYTDSTHLTATAQEALPQSQTVPVYPSPQGTFSVGDVVNGSLSGATGVVVSWAPAASPPSLVVQLIPSSTGGVIGFVNSIHSGTAEVVVGPNGSAQTQDTTSGYPILNGTPQSIAIWDDEVMNALRGYPSNVFFDQNRLGFCNFPALPSGIAWSYIGLPANFLVLPLGQSITAANAIFEFAPDKSQALFVVAGMESSEFVFCDNAIYYIPINATSPLAPGSVSFNLLTKRGCAANVRPKLAEQTILFAQPGATQLSAVQAPGAYYRPFIVDEVSEFHSHLFLESPIVCIACPPVSAQYEEDYAYILRADGVVVCGKYEIKGGLLEPGQDGKPKIGWLPWRGPGKVTWISALDSDVIFTTTYYSTSASSVGLTAAGKIDFGDASGSQVFLVEVLDATQWLDASIPVNALPPPLAPPLGHGPMWLWANGLVALVDTGARSMGVYSVDSLGNIIPQNAAGENLLSTGLMAGQPWLSVLEPFCPDAPPGQSQHQRMFKRRISRMAIYVSSSTGFLMSRLFSSDITPTTPPYGTVMNNYRVSTYNQDDDPTQPPPLRESAYRWRPLGRTYDPRVAIIKDVPGPLIVHEFGIEASI